MVYTRRFCCCLPVRFGVFVMGGLGLTAGILVSVAGWKEVMNLKQSSLPEQNKIALYIQTAMYTLLAIVSFLGLIGSIIRRRTLVSIYSTMLFVHFGASVGTGAFFLYSLFHQDGQDDVSKCENGSTSTLTKDLCSGGFSVLRGVIVGIFVIIWLIELYGCFIVSNYAEQLEEEEASEIPKSAAVPGPPMATTYNGYRGAAGYSFSSSGNSYGAQNV